MNYDYLMDRAETYWNNCMPLPINLFYEMLSAGIDVDGAEKQFNLMKQYNDDN